MSSRKERWRYKPFIGHCTLNQRYACQPHAGKASSLSLSLSLSLSQLHISNPLLSLFISFIFFHSLFSLSHFITLKLTETHPQKLMARQKEKKLNVFLGESVFAFTGSYHIPVRLDMLRANVLHEACKAFIQPQTIPPRHCDVIPKPLHQNQEQNPDMTTSKLSLHSSLQARLQM